MLAKVAQHGKTNKLYACEVSKIVGYNPVGAIFIIHPAILHKQ
jgi:hypothetical protein